LKKEKLKKWFKLLKFQGDRLCAMRLSLFYHYVTMNTSAVNGFMRFHQYKSCQVICVTETHTILIVGLSPMLYFIGFWTLCWLYTEAVEVT